MLKRFFFWKSKNNNLSNDFCCTPISKCDYLILLQKKQNKPTEKKNCIKVHTRTLYILLLHSYYQKYNFVFILAYVHVFDFVGTCWYFCWTVRYTVWNSDKTRPPLWGSVPLHNYAYFHYNYYSNFNIQPVGGFYWKVKLLKIVKFF